MHAQQQQQRHIILAKYSQYIYSTSTEHMTRQFNSKRQHVTHNKTRHNRLATALIQWPPHSRTRATIPQHPFTYVFYAAEHTSALLSVCQLHASTVATQVTEATTHQKTTPHCVTLAYRALGAAAIDHRLLVRAVPHSEHLRQRCAFAERQEMVDR
jgi:hypothetical protein